MINLLVYVISTHHLLSLTPVAHLLPVFSYPYMKRSITKSVMIFHRLLWIIKLQLLHS